MFAFVLTVLATRARTGEETLTFYRDALAVLAAATAVTAALGGSIFAHLDVTAIGLLILLTFGRIGCLVVGCCHGRPTKRGLVYGRRHAALGFPLYLVGRPVVPVPLFEAAAALAVSAAAIGTLDRERPGAALGFVIVAYGLVRIPLEELRGDWDRPYFAAISEAQWTSIVLILVTAVATWTGILPPGFPALAPVALVVEAAGLAYIRRRERRVVTAPGHLRELLKASRVATAYAGDGPLVVTTSRGIRLSMGHTGTRAHVTFSSASELPSEETRELAGALAELCLPPYCAELVPGVAGVLHLLTGASRSAHLESDATRPTQPAPLLPRLSLR
jgi:hypothetical protein